MANGIERAINAQKAGVAIQRPVLMTPAQIAMEVRLLDLWRDPDVMNLRRAVEAELGQLDTARSCDGAMTLGRAVSFYTASFISSVISLDPDPLHFFWWENAPHVAGGHQSASNGIAGDNPDHIYRRIAVDGSRRYEITGQIDLSNRPALLVFEVMRGRIGPIDLTNQDVSADMGNFVACLTDDRMAIGPDGHFRILVGGGGGDGDYMPLAPGENTVMVREVLSDWGQKPARLDIRQIAGPAPVAASFAEEKASVLEGLPAYVAFWGSWHKMSREGLDPNQIKPPVARDGGFGYAGHLRFSLKENEAVLLTLRAGGARYFGVHATDPWQITADSRHHQVTLNNAQSRPNPDGTYNFVMAPCDPGVANWVDTAGMHEGYGILRWQGTPSDFSPDQAVVGFEILSFETLRKRPGLIHVDSAERAALQLANFVAYARRSFD